MVDAAGRPTFSYPGLSQQSSSGDSFPVENSSRLDSSPFLALPMRSRSSRGSISSYKGVKTPPLALSLEATDFPDTPTVMSSGHEVVMSPSSERRPTIKDSTWWQQNSPETSTITSPMTIYQLNHDTSHRGFLRDSMPVQRQDPNLLIGSMSPSFTDWDPSGPVETAMEDFRGRVVAMAKVQFGSRFLQRQLLKATPTLLQLMISEVENDMDSLMVDPYGNYFCQQLFKTCHLNQPERLVTKIAMHAVKISSDRRGTHAMQTLISLLKTRREEFIVISHIKPHVLEMALNRHATHVLQRVLGCFSFSSILEILRPLIDELPQLAHHPHGICVVKRCLSAVSVPITGFTPEDQALEAARLELCETVQNSLSFHVKNLIQSPYGNYALQHALDVWGEAPCKSLMAQIKGNLIALSTQKFSSNVVEKCLQYASDEDISDIINDFSDLNKMAVLVNSSFGNFVVQKAVDRTTHEQSLALYNAITTSASQLQNKRLQLKWERILQKIRLRLPKKGKSQNGLPCDTESNVPYGSDSLDPTATEDTQASSSHASPGYDISPPLQQNYPVAWLGPAVGSVSQVGPNITSASQLSDRGLWQDDFSWALKPSANNNAPRLPRLDSILYPTAFTTLSQFGRDRPVTPESVTDVRASALRMCQGVYPYEPLSNSVLPGTHKEDPFLCL